MSEKRGFEGLSDLVSDIDVDSALVSNQNSVNTDNGSQTVNMAESNEKTVAAAPKINPARKNVNSRDPIAKDVSASTKSGHTPNSYSIVIPKKIYALLGAIPWQLYLIIVVGGYFYIQDVRKESLTNDLQRNVRKYLIKQYDSNYVLPLSHGIVPIDLRRKSIDSMLFDFNDSYKPSSASDVSIAIAFDCTDSLIGKYSDGALGYQKTCNVFIIDTNKHIWSYVGNLVGSEPPQSKKGGGTRTGSHPVRDYLKRAGVM